MILTITKSYVFYPSYDDKCKGNMVKIVPKTVIKEMYIKGCDHLFIPSYLLKFYAKGFM